MKPIKQKKNIFNFLEKKKMEIIQQLNQNVYE